MTEIISREPHRFHIFIAIFAENSVNAEVWLCEVVVVAAGLFPAVRRQSSGYFVNAPIEQKSLIYMK